MPDQAVNKIYTLAGIDFPAGHHTLCYLLNDLTQDLAKQQSSAGPAEIIASIEMDSALLAAFVSRAFGSTSSADLSKWHYNFTQNDMRQTVLAMSNRLLSREVPLKVGLYQAQLRQQSIVRAHLCQSIAESCGLNSKSYALLGLLASIGEQVAAAQAGEHYSETMMAKDSSSEHTASLREAGRGLLGRSAESMGSDLFQSWGLSRQLSDAVLYQFAELEDLIDASQEIQVLALANHLMSISEVPSQALLKVAETLFEIDAAGVTLAIAQAETHRAVVEVKVAKQDARPLVQLLAEANLAASINYQLDIDSENQNFQSLAQLMLGVDAVQRFQLLDGRLIAKLPSGESISLPAASTKSQIALCYQTQQTITAERESLASIIDKQLVDRLGASVVWLLPLENHGVLACAAQKLSPNLGHLLEAYRLALLHNFNRADTEPMLNAEFVRQQVRQVTHEVNNPLAIVQNYLYTLSMELADDSRVQADIEIMRRELLRIGGIVEKYGDIGKPSDSKKLAVNVNDVISELASVFQGGHGDIHFNLRLDSAMPKIPLNVDSLKQVLVNLLKNAVEALRSVSGDAPLEVRVGTEAGINLGGQQYVEIIVSDNGPGMADDIRANLFSPNNSSKGGHAGLGLSIVKQLIAEAGGMVSCRSRTALDGNQGTQFQILMPS